MFVETYMPRPYYHTKFLILGQQWYILNKIWTISLWSPCHPYGQYVVAIKSKFNSFVIKYFGQFKCRLKPKVMG